jgi:hypothetical protein
MCCEITERIYMLKQKFVVLTSVCLSLLLLSSGPANAQDTVVNEEQGQVAKYVNGGIGDGQTRYMQSIAKNWPMRIMFSQLKANEFVAGVNLQITDRSNSTMLQLDSAGPLTYVQLPPGAYRVTATYGGQSQTRNVTLGRSNRSDVHFHWRGAVENDPFDSKPLGGSQVPG